MSSAGGGAADGGAATAANAAGPNNAGGGGGGGGGEEPMSKKPRYDEGKTGEGKSTFESQLADNSRGSPWPADVRITLKMPACSYAW